MSYQIALYAVDPVALRDQIIALADSNPETLLAWVVDDDDEDEDSAEWAHEALGRVRDHALADAGPPLAHADIAWALARCVEHLGERAHDAIWSRGFWEFVDEDLSRLWGHPDLSQRLLGRGLFGANGECFPCCGWLSPAEAAACLAAWDAAGDGRLDGVSEDEEAVAMTEALRGIAAAGRHAVFIYG